MDGIRLNKVAKELNVGIPTIVKFLAKEGYEVIANPNTRIDESQYTMILDAFKNNQEVEDDASKIAIPKIIDSIDLTCLEERMKSKTNKDNVKLVYGENNYFIGMILFFDSIKDFGFIASNNCGMPVQKYKQDFYVNSDSFVDVFAKKENTIVVFQVGKQRNGRLKAVNVRKIAAKEEDYKLALKYYGEYEMIENKNGEKINLFCRIEVPRSIVAEHVKTIIQKDKCNSSPNTVEHLVFFIEHYKENIRTTSSIEIPTRRLYGQKNIESQPIVFTPDKYIFDRDFTKEEKSVWSSFVEVLDDNEMIELLKIYPSYCKYVTNHEVLSNWINSFFKAESTLAYLQGLIDLMPFLPDKVKEMAEIRLTEVFEQKQQAVLNGESSFGNLKKYPALLKYISRGEALEAWIRGFYNTQSSVNDLKVLKELCNFLCEDIKDDALKQLEEIANNKILELLRENAENMGTTEESLARMIEQYKAFTSNKHEEEINECLKHIRYRTYRETLNNFRERDYDIYYIKDIYKRIDIIKIHSDEYHDEISNDMRELLDVLLSREKYSTAIALLDELDFLGYDFSASYKARLKPLVSESLKTLLFSVVTIPHRLEGEFFRAFNTKTSFFEKDEIESLKKGLLPIIEQHGSLTVLSICFERGWLTKNSALKRMKEIVSMWSFTEMNNFLSDHNEHLFNGDEVFKNVIIEKALELIGKYHLSDFFDGRDKNEEEKKSYPDKPKNFNCEYLRKLNDYKGKTYNNENWAKYINTRTVEDSIILYNNGIIGCLTDRVISYVVNSISLDNVKDEPSKWYYAPEIEDKNTNKILTNATSDVFPFIANRLAKMEMSSENIPLVVLLVELLGVNKPQVNDYYHKREWEERFTTKINDLKASHPDNARLGVILWAIYSGVSASTSSLKDVIPLLPPYVQIRCVKKLFMYMSKGVKQYTAKQLYELLGGSDGKLCFPLDIAFYYLKMREKNPDATMSNNNMLELLDGRENHSEWTWIRMLLSNCVGRWKTEELEDNRSNWKRGSYYNGLIEKKNGTSDYIVFVPNKMIDDGCDLTEYNNKYRKDIAEYIAKTYSVDEYKVVNESRGTFYIFGSGYELELYTIARYFNVKFEYVDNYLDFNPDKNYSEMFCECRMSDKPDSRHGVSFYWCDNKPCFRPPLRFMLDSEWERYTILDFMRILRIPTNYTNKAGKCTRYGHYIIFSSYFKNFEQYYKHLKCLKCGKLMKPIGLSNFANRAVTEFQCENGDCVEKGKLVYLNHCFNKGNCDTTIDSRVSKTCPNGQYICPNCGACCSTENFKQRISNLHMTGGYISDRIMEFVRENKGHWEKGERYCYRCGKKMTSKSGVFVCENCNMPKNVESYRTITPPILMAAERNKGIYDDNLPF